MRRVTGNSENEGDSQSLPQNNSTGADAGEEPPQVPPREASLLLPVRPIRRPSRIRELGISGIQRRLSARLALPLPQQAAQSQNEVRPSQAGYECEIITPPEELSLLQTKCPICLLIPRKPHMVTCCCHKFCETCIRRVMTNDVTGMGISPYRSVPVTRTRQRPCPLCNAATYSIVHEKHLERILNGLKVHCNHQKDGCEWTGELVKLDLHLNETPKDGDQLDGCRYVEIKCASGCDKKFQRCVIQEHQRECLNKPYTCTYCKGFESTYLDVKMKHWPQCKSFPSSCPNNCGVHNVKRMDLQAHLNSCPLQMVNCDFYHAGCSTRLLRKKMPEHMKANTIGHLSLLAQQNARLIQELDECKQRIKILEDPERRQNVPIANLIELD